MQDSKPIKANFQYSLENFRGLAIVFVVFSHFSSFEKLGGIGDFLLFLFRDATTWFVFISGYLFNYIEQRRFSYRTYLQKKIKFVILPYVILSVPAIAAGIVSKQYIFIGLDPLPYSLWSLIVGGPVIGPMWFIPMIAIFFLASPLFHRIGSSSLQYLIVMAALAFSLYSERPLYNMNPFLSFVHFSGFYILGVVASSNVKHIREYERTKSVMPIMCGAFLLFIVASAIYLLGDQYESIGFEEGLGTFNNAQFGKLALLVAVFFFFNRFLDKQNLILAWLAKISFGLFFMQGFFLQVFGQISGRFVISQPLAVLMTEVAIVFGGSIVAVLVIKRVTGRWSRYVIGF